MQRIRVGIIGLGKIALDEHVPALCANSAFEIVATVSAGPTLDGVPVFADAPSLFAATPALDAVAICTPPQAHFTAAKLALEKGLHVLLEKPPCPTVAAFEELVGLAAKRGVTLFQTWHARETAAITAAAAWLKGKRIRHGSVVWKEDVRQWHPGQSWIWNEGGFGVMDAGINAISILTKILPEPLSVEAAHMWVPSNCANPIAAAVVLRTDSGAAIDAEFDFRHPGALVRLLTIETDGGVLQITGHGEALDIDGVRVELDLSAREYVAIYRRFAELVQAGQSDTDARPLELVMDAFTLAGRSAIAPFRE